MGLWKDRKRGDWRYSFKFQKKSYAGAGFKRKKDAAAARENRRKEVKESPAKIPTDTAFSTVANDYLEYSERKHAKKTFDAKKLTYERFISHSGDPSVYDITPAIVHKYLNTRKSNNAYNTNRKELSTLFHYAIRKMKINIQNPCNDLEKMPHTTRRKDIPTEQEVLQMIVAADPKTDERDLILSCIHTLGRIDELLRLEWARDVRFEKREISLWTRKRKGGTWEEDVLFMNDDLYAILRARWERRTQDKWVFYNEKTETRYNRRPKFMAGICKRAGLKPIGRGSRLKKVKGKKVRVPVPLYYGFHSLRHFTASYLADTEKIATKVLQKILRHRNLSTTEIYIHSIEASVSDAMGKMKGKFSDQSEGAIIKEQGATAEP
ncbi:MAG: tyrosine-type recombinase/integrase [Syntrophales bacterium]|nr:tyrosine-type recombinase/integrase [Syntrophales bacterium]